MEGTRTPEVADVLEASARIAGAVRHTPAWTSERLDGVVGCRVVLKCENLQRTGSFKIRGATNAVLTLLDRAPEVRGMAAHSSGNHAQAVALAAREHGLPAAILMPEDAPAEKRDATLAYGAEVVPYDRYREERTTLADAMAEERGYALIPPYDDPDVIAGQGTVALELLEDADPLDALLVPVGGGGLLAGASLVAAARFPRMRLIGVEPDTADDGRRSFEAGRPVRQATAPTICDGQQAPLGDLTFSVIRPRVEGFVTVSDAEVARAMRVLFEEAKIVTEPSGASALAGLLAHRDRLGLEGARVGIVLSGGNVSAGRFGAIVGER